jgi:MFS family permease
VAALGAGYLSLTLLVVLVLDAGVGRSDAGGQSGRGRGLGSLPWRDPGLWLLLLAYVPIYAFITSIGLHFPAFQRDLGRTAEAASWIYGLTTIVGAGGSILCGWLSERWSARWTLLVVTIGLLGSSLVLWFPVGLGAYYAWAVGYGVVNAGVVALLALVLRELFGAAQIGALMGLAISVCMAATMLGNWFSASVHDQIGTYVPVWRTYSGLLLLALAPLMALLRRDALQENPQTAS